MRGCTFAVVLHQKARPCCYQHTRAYQQRSTRQYATDQRYPS
jgi:hypothetical protein